MIPKTQKNRNRCVMRHHLVADATEYPAHLTFQAPLVQNLMAFTQFVFGVVQSLCASMALPCLVPPTLSVGADFCRFVLGIFRAQRDQRLHLLVNVPYSE